MHDWDEFFIASLTTVSKEKTYQSQSMDFKIRVP